MTSRRVAPSVEPLIQYVVFATLLVLTPFIVVTRYLQGIVHVISHFQFSIFGKDIPVVLGVAVAVAAVLLVRSYRYLTFRKLSASLLAIAMLTIAHRVQDTLLDMSFFDLQQNWHYVSYAAYVFFFFRAFFVRSLSLGKTAVAAFFSALVLSVFDEVFQLFLSNRVFDISDITKDAWGALIGLVVILFVTETYGTMNLRETTWWRRRIRDYFNDPVTTLLFLFFLTGSFLVISPLLTEHDQWATLCVIGFGTGALVFMVYHFMQFSRFRFTAIGVSACFAAGLTVSCAINHDKNITYNEYGITVYRGIPVVFFDLMVFPDGSFRLLDKKHHYRSQDRKYFYKQKPDILVIGSGMDGRGGKGFRIREGTAFIFNSHILKGTQLIILPNSDAVAKFNELRVSGKRVMIVLHNTC